MINTAFLVLKPGLFHEDLVNIMTDGALDIGRQIVD